MQFKLISVTTMVVLVGTLAACGGVGAPGEAVEEDLGSTEQAFTTAAGPMSLATYSNGTWSFDGLTGEGVWDPQFDITVGPFGDPGDIPLLGYGPVQCGKPGGKKGVYRPSTKQFFFDLDASNTWNAGDLQVDNFVGGFDFNWVIHPFIFTVPSVGGGCKGVIGYTAQIGTGPRNGDIVWFIDADDNKVSRGNVDIYSDAFGGGIGNEDWPVPLWSAAKNSSILTIFRRNTGEWFQDLNNNKRFDGCATDGCTWFGNPADFPFGHSNSIIRGVSRFEVANSGFVRYVDRDANGFWSGNIADGQYPNFQKLDVYALIR